MEPWVEQQIELYRVNRHRIGQEPDRMGEALAGAAATASASHFPENQAKLELIRNAIKVAGSWNDDVEWRVMTWFARSIRQIKTNVGIKFQVAVECDGQRFEARCPTIEKAYSVMRTYEQIIVAQFYSVGPPWADNGQA